MVQRRWQLTVIKEILVSELPRSIKCPLGIKDTWFPTQMAAGMSRSLVQAGLVHIMTPKQMLKDEQRKL